MKTSPQWLACLSLLFLALSSNGGVNAATTAKEIYDIYGSIAGYLIFSFGYLFGNPNSLQQELLEMKSNGNLQKMCQYLPTEVSQCLKATPASSHQETELLVAALNTQCCNGGQPTNGNWGSWGSWASCSATCDGTQTRFRNCDSPASSGGGATCFGGNNQTQRCGSTSCVTVSWANWGSWSSCTASCGGGARTRTRVCSGGNTCIGSSSDAETCNANTCEGSWGTWSSCSVSCGGGTQSRFRTCTSGGIAVACTGGNFDTTSCSTTACVTEGSWGTWSSCSVSCGGGTQSRFRTCTSGGIAVACTGGNFDTTSCSTTACVTEGSWGTWSSCSVSCGGGTQSRFRTCTSGGIAVACTGGNFDTTSCSTTACVAEGIWGTWSSCSVTCGSGTQTRSRTCTSGGITVTCVGGNSQTTTCSDAICVTEGSWGTWSSCSVSCGGGTQSRFRTCTSGGIAVACTGGNFDTTSCSTTACGFWGTWSAYGSCSATCGGGSQTRTRVCSVFNTCSGSSTDTLTCNTNTCGFWGTWSAYGSCSATCGGGSQTRTRVCSVSNTCSGSSTDTLTCNTNTCGFWGTWSAYGSCSATCGGGSQTRTRVCSVFNTCSGSSTDTLTCNTNTCVTEGSWGTWSSCSVTCGSGFQTRSRTCTSGGITVTCPLGNSQTISCSTTACAAVARSCGRYTAPGVTAKIVRGFDSVPGRYPWVAMLLNSNNIECGAIIIDNQHVLTASHCLDDNTLNDQLNSNGFEVIVGQYQRTGDPLATGAQRVFVTSGTIHQNYDSISFINDIAVLRLATPLVFNDLVAPVCLPAVTDTLPSRCTVAGWGRLSYLGPTPDVLQEVELDTYSRTNCSDTFQATTLYDINTKLTDGVMCAANGTIGGQDSCSGDSGSSLMCLQTDSNGLPYWNLFGIVSSGFRCANAGQPGFYTYVPFYANWIQSTVDSLVAKATAG